MAQFLLPEFDAMQQMASILDALAPAERKRVMAWLVEYAASDDGSVGEYAEAGGLALTDGSVTEPQMPADTTSQTFAEFYERVAPKTGVQKAACAGYWLESVQDQRSWKAFDVNKLLKSIDVRVSSISIVLSNAVKSADPMITMLERTGEGDRARKTFCLSERGVQYVTSRMGL